jgi:GDP-L-fucose synthase
VEIHKKTRVAVLGGTGFLGSHLRAAFEGAGFTTGVFSRTTGCDLLDLSSAWALLDAFNPDYLINSAALVGSVNYVSDFAADVIDVNTRIVLNVYKIAQQMRDVVVINPAANCAYPGIMDDYEEDHLFDGPVHPSVQSYGTTRRMMITASRCYNDQYGVRSVNLLVPNLYGPMDSVNPNKTHALNALVIKFVSAIKREAPEIEVWGTGTPIREWLYVKDLARIMLHVIQSGDESLEPVNVAQSRGQTVTELVEVLKGLTGYRGNIRYDLRYPDGAPKKVMNDRRFRQRFPDFQFTPLVDGIRETIDYYMRVLQAVPPERTGPRQ